MRLKKGISLIVLVITIIVIIILAGAVILSLANNNPIAQANEATFKSNIDAYNSELSMSISKKYVQNPNLDTNTINATTWDGINATDGTVKELIPSISSTDAKKYAIANGKLVYAGLNKTEQQWAKTIGITDGLILWLDGKDFKNSPQSAVWTDKSGNNNDATPVNISYTTTSGSDGNGNVAFDGVNDYFKINNVINNSRVSIECRLKVDPSNQTLSAIGIYGVEAKYRLLSSTSDYSFATKPTNQVWYGAGTLASGYIANMNNYYHVVATYDGSYVKIYINGVLAGTGSNAISGDLEPGNPKIGYAFASNVNYLKGNISYIKVYNRPLSVEEIQQKYSESL